MLITRDPIGLKFLEPLKHYHCYAGLDLAAVSDLTSLALTWEIRDRVYVYPWYFLPSDGLVDRCKQDRVPYNEWSQAGYLELTQGSTTDWRYVVQRIIDLSKVFKIKELGFDPWGARDVVRELTENGVNCVDVSQNISSMSAPAKRFQTLILDKKLIHTGHPILRWNLDCCTIYTDANNNIKVEKPDIGKSSKRIDGVIATIIGLHRLQKAPPVAPKSVYSTRGVLTL